jgi:hypothetical protein
MEYEITINISTSDSEAPIEEFVTALETLLTWQWDNVMLRVKEVE